ncbi:MAG: TIGR02757 family protein [Planctomycetes bacterium RBG_13_44_8b]|nr:MAG: TIGR02757 family protein [Planctomycetes bacterium RBG_13_44_8b]
MEQIEQIKELLERLYVKYNHREFIPPDPLQFLHKYPNPADKEVVALLSAELAYGRVEQIEKSLNDLFSRMGASPYAFVRNFSEADNERLKNFKHRFTSGQDISDLLEVLRDVLDEKGCIENYFLLGYKETDQNIIPALSQFCESLLDRFMKSKKAKPTKGLQYLLTNPEGGSACKRMNLFLRWMVRKDEVDPGLWNSFDKAKLVVPVDVHMARLCKILGLYNQKTASLTAALKITESFTEIEPIDPVKYDFALSRIGILEDCNGKPRLQCQDCELLELCNN